MTAQAVVDITGQFAAGAGLIYTAQLLDGTGAAIPASALSALTLSIVDPMTGDIVNGVDAVNILNTGRGAVDGSGNLTVTLGPNDTAIDPTLIYVLPIRRALIIDWTYNGGEAVGRHQVNFMLTKLAGP